MSVIVRPVVEADIPDLIAMVDELNAHEDEPTGYLTAKKAMRDLIGPDAALGAFVAEVSDALVGFAFWHPAYETAYAARGGFLTDLYVRAAHRRTGVGKALVQAVARASAAQGGEFLWLTAYAHNDNAQRFYRRLMNVEEDRIVAHALTGEHFKALL